MPPAVEAIAARFAVSGKLLGMEPFGSGYINDSYRLTYECGGRNPRYLLQRINDSVFKRPDLMMENIRRVTVHIASRLESQGVPDVGRRVLRLVLTQDGVPYCCDAAGAYWRLYGFIEGTQVHESPKAAGHAEQAGRAFGMFQCLLADLPGPRLHETIPDFHNTPLRLAALERAVQADRCGRVAAARAEIEFAFSQRALAAALLDLHRAGQVPERVVHNDAKLSNVLLDRMTAEALCVVDLDTVMPGLSLYDFGDMVRSMTSTAAEDETDLSKIELQMPLFEGLARGYLEAAGAFLTPAERSQLVTAGKVITFEQGLRFLTDFLEGDRYYKTSRPAHNLDRCRTQFKLVRSISGHERRMNRLVESL